MLDDFLTQQQADELTYHGYFELYEVDCDDGTKGDIVYAIRQEVKQSCSVITIPTVVPSTCGAP